MAVRNKMKRLFVLTSAILLICSQTVAREIVDTLDMAKHNIATVEHLILGKVSGVDVTSETGSKLSSVNTTIRGVNSLKSDSQPLWIVDGTMLNPVGDVDNPFWEYGSLTYTAPQDNLLGINVYDIESIKVLKDVSATAIYGSRGANGVIIINTRYPKAPGRKLGLRLNSDVSFEGAHQHTLSFSGFRNNTSYYISGFFRRQKSNESNANFGGLRFNFLSRANAVVQVGFSGMASLGRQSALNPMLPADSDIDDNADDFRTTDSFFLILNPFKGFSVKATAGIDYRVKERYMWYGPTTDFGYINNGAVSVSTMSAFQYNLSLNVGYERYFGKHHLNVNACADLISRTPRYTVMCGYNFFDMTLRSKGLSVASGTSPNRVNTWKETQTGITVSASYDYDEKVGTDLVWRMDKENNFEKKMIHYPSVEVWVNIKKLLMPEVDFLSGFDIVGGWGKAGSNRYIPYQWMGDYTLNCPEVVVDYQPFYRGFTKTVSSEYNAGLETGFFQDRLRFDLKYYHKITDEATSFWCNGIDTGKHGIWNYGDNRKVFEEKDAILNEGIEIDINADIFNSHRFGWYVGLIGSYNFNVVEYIPYVDNAPNSICNRWVYSNVAGLSSRQIVGYTLNGDGTIFDRNNDGRITEADITCLGSTTPKFIAGVSTVLRLYGFTLEAMATMRFGSRYLDFGKLLSEDIPGKQALVTSSHIISGDKFIPARATLTYDVPLGKIKDIMGLKVSFMVANGLPAFGYSAYLQRPSYIGGICLTF